ncbi:GNAT family N-acetyltransferase [Kocuria sp. JC486]|uniref:N-acetyltransferase n=1 Tax=Kocuria soli TaxID=2485125 RepID=A0A3N3ZNL8_9MICC|nr:MULTISPECIES: GNAT family N-acetyltransferase [Kocuria]NHU85148.1 GNAT family N-acetyltransferase [Kocuria sp. JC486]ROZ62480.1 N-acetyltransferase [Kocuria soli]
MNALQLPTEPPTLSDEKVTLAALSEADVDQLVLNCTDPTAVKWTTVPTPYTEQDARGYILEYVPKAWQEGSALNWAVHDHDGQLLGTIELARVRASAADIGLNFGPHARGTGAAVAACRLLIDYAFDELGLTHLHWIAFDGNWASVKLSWKVGFQEPVFIPGFLEQRGELWDCWHATLLASSPRTAERDWRVPTSS